MKLNGKGDCTFEHNSFGDLMIVSRTESETDQVLMIEEGGEWTSKKRPNTYLQYPDSKTQLDTLAKISSEITLIPFVPDRSGIGSTI